MRTRASPQTLRLLFFSLFNFFSEQKKIGLVRRVKGLKNLIYFLVPSYTAFLLYTIVKITSYFVQKIKNHHLSRAGLINWYILSRNMCFFFLLSFLFGVSSAIMTSIDFNNRIRNDLFLWIRKLGTFLLR